MRPTVTSSPSSNVLQQKRVSGQGAMGNTAYKGNDPVVSVRTMSLVIILSDLRNKIIIFDPSGLVGHAHRLNPVRCLLRQNDIVTAMAIFATSETLSPIILDHCI